MERKTYFILGSLLFLLIFIIYRLKTSGEDLSITTPIDSPENIHDFKRAINKLIKVIDKDRKSNKLLLNEIQKMNKLNKLHTRYLQDIQPKIFNKDIEKQRIYIDTHNIHSTFNRAKYTYYLDSSDTINQNNAAGYGGGFKNVIGFRLVKALIPNTHDVVDSEGLVIWVKLTDKNTNNVFGLEFDANNQDKIINYIGDYSGPNEVGDDAYRYHDRDEIMQIEIPKLSLTAQNINSMFQSNPDNPSSGAIYSWKNSTPDHQTYTGPIGNSPSFTFTLPGNHNQLPPAGAYQPQSTKVFYFLKEDVIREGGDEADDKMMNSVGWNVASDKFYSPHYVHVQSVTLWPSIDNPWNGHNPPDNPGNESYYRLELSWDYFYVSMLNLAGVIFTDNRPPPTGLNFIYNKCKRSPEEDLESLYGLTSKYNRNIKKFEFRCTGRDNSVLDKYKKYTIEETSGGYGDNIGAATDPPLSREPAITSSTSNYSINFKFLWDDLWNETAGVHINRLLGFNQINIPSENQDLANKGLVSTIHPNMITHYIDLIINEIPYIACKKNALGRKLIERIGLMGGLGELVEYVQPWETENENYFYPINLTRLNIEIYSHESHKLFDDTRDHSLEFEITTIKNPKKFNLI